MALDMTPEQKEIGKGNFHRAVGQMANESVPGPDMTRRSFMKGLLAGGAALPISAAAYFGYQRLHGNPVKAGLIGTGDEGGILIGEHNPDYVKIVAVSDIRPSNVERIFRGEPERPGAPLWRKGLERLYGRNARSEIKVHEKYQDLLADPEIEMVIIALPLHLHAEVSIAAMRAGKHVLCEKLMAWNIRQCKEMIRVADETDRLLSIGHQRHYSLLYAQANELLAAGLLGDIKHIRALWHRNNTIRDSWRPDIKPEDQRALADRVRSEFHYKDMDELVRWRLYQRTGGGLMAELGSHQLDACSIFLGKKHPLAVSAVGGKFFYKDNREIEDHVFCTYEFPGKDYQPGSRQRDDQGRTQYSDNVVVTYSSINTNNFEKYGECVMGSKGTLVVEEELNVMMWPATGAPRATSVAVTTSGAGPALDTSASWTGGADPKAAATTIGAGSVAPASRGYREEMEHLAWCIRMRDQGMERNRADMQPRCHGRAAMADAIIALTTNQAMKRQTRILFDERWFDAASPEVPDADMVPEQV